MSDTMRWDQPHPSIFSTMYMSLCRWEMRHWYKTRKQYNNKPFFFSWHKWNVWYASAKSAGIRSSSLTLTAQNTLMVATSIKSSTFGNITKPNMSKAMMVSQDSHLWALADSWAFLSENSLGIPWTSPQVSILGFISGNGMPKTSGRSSGSRSSPSPL